MATNNAINLSDAGIASYDGAGAFSALAVPLTVANGGTGVSSTTAYSLACGGTTTTAAIQFPTIGTAGQAFTSNGAGALGSFQDLASGGAYVIKTSSSLSSTVSGSTTYYLASGSTTNFTSSVGATRIYIPIAGTINIVYGSFSTSSFSNTNTSTLAIRLNDTTSTTISSSITTHTATSPFSTTSLGVAVVAGDFVEFLWTTPNWPTTNPSGVTFGASLVVS